MQEANGRDCFVSLWRGLLSPRWSRSFETNETESIRPAREHRGRPIAPFEQAKNSNTDEVMIQVRNSAIVSFLIAQWPLILYYKTNTSSMSTNDTWHRRRTRRLFFRLWTVRVVWKTKSIGQFDFGFSWKPKKSVWIGFISSPKISQFIFFKNRKFWKNKNQKNRLVYFFH
jgi:hypothetical protein